MKCPVCKSISLQMQTNEAGLVAYTCSSCEGSWIRYPDYFHWQDSQSSDESAAATEFQSDYRPEYDSKKPGFCPDCGIILAKYKVSNRLPFSVDHCGRCNGVWLDKNEWESLQKDNLHRQMNQFFTSPWQAKLRSELTRERLEQHYRERFGDDYDKLKELREWLYANRSKKEMLAFLIDEDPFKI